MMKLIKVDATTSTNELSKALNIDESSGNFCVSAEFQMNGRGQQHTSWQSNKSENILFTIVYNTIDLDLDKRFCLNALVCLSVYNVLKQAGIRGLALKWPNDIMADGFKISGILIENTIVGSKIKHAYVGIGLNVNQTQFDNLPRASSLKILTEVEFDRAELLDKLIKELRDLPKALQLNSAQNIINVYKRYLFGYKKLQQFELPNLKRKRGKIKDVELDGKLLVEFESGQHYHFEHKAIQQLY